MAGYLRFAALGDSATFGIGDPTPTGWRGWARLLAESLASSYDVSACHLAVPGATGTAVLGHQLAEAIAHRPDVASLIVGVNDTLRSTWDPARLRGELMTCAEALTGAGAVLLTARFHDHSAVLGLPAALRRPLLRRLAELNGVWDEVHHTFGGARVDLGAHPEALDRSYWSVDRMHPGERGHRLLARHLALDLHRYGYDFELPSLECSGGLPSSRRREAAWLIAEGAPWIGRRARDLGPWAVRRAVRRGDPAVLGVRQRRQRHTEGQCRGAGQDHGAESRPGFAHEDLVSMHRRE